MPRPLTYLLTAGFIAAASLVSISCEGPVGPPGAGFGTLDDPSVMPAVIYTYPPMNSRGPYADFYVSDCYYGNCPWYSMIQVRFNKFMDVSSVRKAMRIVSPSGGVTTDTGRIVSFGGDVVAVTPVDTFGNTYGVRYEVAEVYTLLVDTTAVDINGNRLAAPFAMTFVPEPYFHTVRMSPENGSDEFDPRGSIVLSFNAGVDSSIIPFIHINPTVDIGIYVYPGERQVTLYPPGGLGNLTKYVVTVDSGAPDENGHTQPSRFTAKFTTEGFGVQYWYPRNGTSYVGLTTPVELVFTSAIDTASSNAAFSVDPPVEGRITHFLDYTNSSRAVFEPAGGWDGLTKYTVSLDTSLRSDAGTPLSAPWHVTFTTAPFYVYIQFPYDGGSGVSRYPYIRVSSSGPIDTSTVAGAISLTPPVPLNILWDGGPTAFTTVPSALLAPSTRYVFKVDTTLKTMRGVHLAFPDSSSFVTAPLE